MFYFLSFCLFVFCCCFCFSTREKFGGWASKVLSFYVVFVLLSFGLFLCWHEISWDVGRAAGLKTKKFLQSNCNFWHVTWNLFKVVSIKLKSLWGFSASGKLIMYNIFREINYPRDMVDTIHKPIPGNFSRNKQSLWLQPPRRERTFSWSLNKKSSWTKLLCLKALHFTHWVYFWGCSPYELGDSSKYYRDIS